MRGIVRGLQSGEPAPVIRLNVCEGAASSEPASVKPGYVSICVSASMSSLSDSRALAASTADAAACLTACSCGNRIVNAQEKVWKHSVPRIQVSTIPEGIYLRQILASGLK